MAKINAEKRAKLLEILKRMGQDESLAEFIYHLQKVVEAYEEVGGKLEQILDMDIVSVVKQLQDALEGQQEKIGESIDVVATGLISLSNSVESIKPILETLKPEKLELGEVLKALNALPQRGDILDQVKFLVKISDSVTEFRKDVFVLKQELKNNSEVNSELIQTLLSNFSEKIAAERKDFVEALQKVNVTVSGGGASMAPTMRSLETLGSSVITVNTTVNSLVAENTKRKRVIIQNAGTTILYLYLGTTTPSTSAYSVALAACTAANDGKGGSFIDEMWQGAVKAISSADGGKAAVTIII